MKTPLSIGSQGFLKVENGDKSPEEKTLFPHPWALNTVKHQPNEPSTYVGDYLLDPT
jgi:hypothetical protein